MFILQCEELLNLSYFTYSVHISQKPPSKNDFVSILNEGTKVFIKIQEVKLRNIRFVFKKVSVKLKERLTD